MSTITTNDNSGVTDGNSGPGFTKNPEHTIKIEPTTKHVRAILNGETIADTTRALALWEADYPACYYIPRADVRDDLIAGSPTNTYCPYKGTASYWSFTVNGKTVKDAAWSYEAPYDEVMEIKGHFAFYPDRIDELLIEG